VQGEFDGSAAAEAPCTRGAVAAVHPVASCGRKPRGLLQTMVVRISLPWGG
jgi:hypothetical protein